MPIVQCQNQQCQKMYHVPPSKVTETKFCARACFYASRASKILPVQERFWAKVSLCIHGIECPYCCFEWNAAKNPAQYGCFNLGNNHVKTSNRCAWEFWNNRSMPFPLHAAHYCNNPPCCNPNHIYAATSQRNVDDCVKANRHAIGERNGHAKLTDSDIPHIFMLYRNGMSQPQIAKSLGISKSNIGRILKQEQWIHLLQEDVSDISHIAQNNLSHKGTKNPASKLVEEDIPRIFAAYKIYKNQYIVAKQFHVGQNTISQILQRKKWTHVPIP